MCANGDVYLGSVVSGKVWRVPAPAADLTAAVEVSDGAAQGVTWVRPFGRHTSAIDQVYLACRVVNDKAAFTNLNANGKEFQVSGVISDQKLIGSKISLDPAGVHPVLPSPEDPSAPTPQTVAVVYRILAGAGPRALQAPVRLFSVTEAGSIIGAQLGSAQRWSPLSPFYTYTNSGGEQRVTATLPTTAIGGSRRGAGMKAFTNNQAGSAVGQGPGIFSPSFVPPEHPDLSSAIVLVTTVFEGSPPASNPRGPMLLWSVATRADGLGDVAANYSKDSLATALRSVSHRDDIANDNTTATSQSSRSAFVANQTQLDALKNLTRDVIPDAPEHLFIPPLVGSDRFALGGAFTKNNLGIMCVSQESVNVGQFQFVTIPFVYWASRGMGVSPTLDPIRLYKINPGHDVQKFPTVITGTYPNVSGAALCGFNPIAPSDGSPVPNVITGMAMVGTVLYITAHHHPVITLVDPLTGSNYQAFDPGAQPGQSALWWWDYQGALGPTPGLAARLLPLSIHPLSLDYVGNDAKGARFIMPTADGRSHLISVETNKPAVNSSDPLEIHGVEMTFDVYDRITLPTTKTFVQSGYTITLAGNVFTIPVPPGSGSFQTPFFSNAGTTQNSAFKTSTPNKINLNFTAKGILGAVAPRQIYIDLAIADPLTGVYPIPISPSLTMGKMGEVDLAPPNPDRPGRGFYLAVVQGSSIPTTQLNNVFVGPRDPTILVQLYWNALFDVGPRKTKARMRIAAVHPETRLPIFKAPNCIEILWDVDFRPANVALAVTNDFEDETAKWGISVLASTPSTLSINQIADLVITGGHFDQTTESGIRIPPDVTDPLRFLPGPVINAVVIRKENDDTPGFNLLIPSKTDAEGRPPYWEFQQGKFSSEILLRGVRVPAAGNLRVMLIRKGLSVRRTGTLVDDPKKQGQPVVTVVGKSVLGILKVT